MTVQGPKYDKPDNKELSVLSSKKCIKEEQSIMKIDQVKDYP